MKQVVTFLVVLAIAITSRPEEASACSCAAPRVKISPEDTEAPLNSTVVAWLPHYVGKASDVTFSLRKKSGELVAVDYKPTGMAGITVVEMIPRAALEPTTVYEVMMIKGADASPRSVGSFTTGKTSLTSAPIFHGVATANYYKAVPVCCMCMTDQPYAQIELKDSFDEKRRKEIRIGVWLADATGRIDYKKPPATYYVGSEHIYLGNPSTCSAPNFTFPKSKSTKIGIKIVDLAGNASSAAEITLDTTRPVPPPDR